VRRAAGLWLVLFVAYAAALGVHGFGSGFSAAEAHQLLTAESLVSDRDIDLSDEYRTRAWSSWYPSLLRPTAGLTSGRLNEPQGVGFPLLIAPAYAIAGPTGVQLWLAAIAALGFVLAAALGRRLVPDPWPSAAALVAGLSAPALDAATTVAPGAVAGTVVAGAAVLALRVRDDPRRRDAFWCAALIAALPWLDPRFLPVALMLAAVLFRWLRRRARALAGFIALEVILTATVVYLTVNDRLFAGLTPSAARLGDVHVAGTQTLRTFLLDLRFAPFAALAVFALWLLVRSRRDRLAVAVPDQAHVEVAAAFLGLLCGAAAGFAALPAGGALAAWGLRHAPRAGALLAAVTVAAGVARL
jgi:hypothetical protein